MATNITEFAKNVQPHVLGCPRELVLKAIVEAMIAFCTETHCVEKGFEHDVVTADVITADNNSVNVNLAAYIPNWRPIVITEFKIDGAQWDTAQIDLVNAQEDISEHIIQGAKLFTYPDLTHIKFYDIEAKDQRFWIKQALAPVPTITTVDDLFYYQHHKAIEGRAKFELMSQPGKDWSNPVLAPLGLSDYNDGKAGAVIRKNKTAGPQRVKSTRWF